MSRSINTANLNKNYVLSKVSQVTIFSTYLNLSDAIVQHCIDTGVLILSPIRDDINPTCGFKYDNRGKLKFKDFNGFFWGDCFDLVAFVMSNMYNKRINISNKEDFIKVLKHITLMFKDIFYGKEKDINLITNINTSIVNLKSTKPNIEIVVREWNDDDKKRWAKSGSSLQDLNLEYIYPIDQYYIDRNINPNPKYYYDIKDPCYGYLLGKDKTGINNIKLYFPERSKDYTRFITNCNHLEGIYSLDGHNYDLIVLTKSTKDRVSIKGTIRMIKLLYGGDININLGEINIPHETYKLRQSEYDWLKSKLSEDGIIVSLMDNDKVGIAMAIWLRNNFKIPPIFVPKKDGKDFAEWRENKGLKGVKTPIINTINNIKEYVNTTNSKADKFIRIKEKSNTSPF